MPSGNSIGTTRGKKESPSLVRQMNQETKFEKILNLGAIFPDSPTKSNALEGQILRSWGQMKGVTMEKGDTVYGARTLPPIWRWRKSMM